MPTKDKPQNSTGVLFSPSTKSKISQLSSQLTPLTLSIQFLQTALEQIRDLFIKEFLTEAEEIFRQYKRRLNYFQTTTEITSRPHRTVRQAGEITLINSRLQTLELTSPRAKSAMGRTGRKQGGGITVETRSIMNGVTPNTNKNNNNNNNNNNNSNNTININNNNKNNNNNTNINNNNNNNSNNNIIRVSSHAKIRPRRQQSLGQRLSPSPARTQKLILRHHNQINQINENSTGRSNIVKLVEPLRLLRRFSSLNRDFNNNNNNNNNNNSKILGRTTSTRLLRRGRINSDIITRRAATPPAMPSSPIPTPNISHKSSSVISPVRHSEPHPQPQHMLLSDIIEYDPLHGSEVPTVSLDRHNNNNNNNNNKTSSRSRHAGGIYRFPSTSRNNNNNINSSSGTRENSCFSSRQTSNHISINNHNEITTSELPRRPTVSSSSHSGLRTSSSCSRSPSRIKANRSTLTGVYDWPIGSQTAIPRGVSSVKPYRSSIIENISSPTREISPRSYICAHFASSEINSVMECVKVNKTRGTGENHTNNNNNINIIDDDDAYVMLPKDIILECEDTRVGDISVLQKVINKALEEGATSVKLRVLRGTETLTVREALVN